VALQEHLESEAAVVTTTESGAKIASISPGLAGAFLERHRVAGFPAAGNCQAWGAFDDSPSLIAVGALGAIAPPRGWAWIAVAPERRRLRVGSELMALLASAAAARGLRYLSCQHRSNDPAFDDFVRSLGRTVGRRVNDGTAKVVIILAPTGRVLGPVPR